MNQDLSDIFDQLEKELRSLSELVWLIGSYSRGDFKENSDVDLVVLPKGKLEREKIERKVNELNKSLRKKIDVTYFLPENFKRRTENNDYLLASLMEDEKYLFGDEDLLRESKDKIFSKKPTKESMNFNFMEAVKILDMALITFSNFKYHHRSYISKFISKSEEFLRMVIDDKFEYMDLPIDPKDEDFDLASVYLLRTVRNCIFAIAYLLTFNKMKFFGRTISYKDLKHREEVIEEKLFNEIEKYEEHCKKTKKVDPQTTRRYLIATMNLFAKYLDETTVR